MSVTHDLLVRELGQVPQWDILGTYLGLSESEIQVIERDHHDTARRRLVMLNKWMEKDINASWEKVIDALKSMSQIRLANQLKEKYCSSELVNQVSPKPDVSSFDKEIMVKRQEAIAREIEDLEESYLKLLMDVESAMTEANLSLMKLKRFFKFYVDIKSTTVEELIDLLPSTFLDYALLEKMVKFFLCQHTVANTLRDYCQKLKQFWSSTTVQQFIESIEQAQQSHRTTSERPGLCTVKLRLVGGWLTKTMDDLEKLLNEIFQDKRHVLAHLKIVRGSVIVSFSAPLSEAIALAKKQSSSFALQVGVSQLVVADTVITQSESSDFSFESSLLDSVKDNDLNLLNFLLSINTNPNAADQSNQTALHVASELNQDKCMILLLQANANPNLQDNKGRTPLYIASLEGHIQIVAFLIENNVNPDLPRDNGCTPLYAASFNRHTDVVALLLKNNANPDLPNENGCTPLYIASQNGHSDIIAILLKNNANPDIPKGNGCTPLYIASQNSHTDVIAILLKNNANPDLQETDQGCSPLYIASQNGHTDVVAILLKNNANPDLPRDNGCTPLYIAIQNGYTDVVTLLLKNNASPDLPRDSGCTPLFVASQEGHTDVVALLLKAKANVNLDYNGETPLGTANRHGHSDIVNLLVHAGAADTGIHPHTRDLSTVRRKGRSDVLTSFQTAIPHLELQTRTGNTSLYKANEIGHSDDIQLFQGDDLNTS